MSLQLHLCCVALGTRGDVQPLACIALHFLKSENIASVSFITHVAHASWLQSGIFAPLTDIEYVDSPPAGGCWTQTPTAYRPPRQQPAGGPAPQHGSPNTHLVGAVPLEPAESLAAQPPGHAGGGGGGGGVHSVAPGASGDPWDCRSMPSTSPDLQRASISKPDVRVVEAICNRIAAALALGASEGPSATTPVRVAANVGLCGGGNLAGRAAATIEEEERRESSSHPLPLHLRLQLLRRWLREQGSGGQREPLPLPVLQRQGQSGDKQPQHKSYLVVFNLFALEAYHTAEALGIRCVAAAPYMMPYRCPAGFVGMFHREVPELYDTLRQSAVLEQQQREQACVQGVSATAAASVAAAVLGPATHGRRLSGGISQSPRVTFAEVIHWMWPLFTERWGAWRSTVLGLPPLPLYRQACSEQPQQQQRTAFEYDVDDAANLKLDGEQAGVNAATVRDEPLPLESLPPAPPLLYGFSQLVVPRPSFWPGSLVVCGFWQPPLKWFEGQQLPAELAELLVASQRMVAHVDRGIPAALSSAGQEVEASTVKCPLTTCSCTANSLTPPSPSPPPPPPLPQSSPSLSPEQHQHSMPPLGQSQWCLVDFGSSGRLGLIPEPLDTLQLLDAVLRNLGMSALVLTGGWQPLHRAAEELQYCAKGVGCNTGVGSNGSGGSGFHRDLLHCNHTPSSAGDSHAQTPARPSPLQHQHHHQEVPPPPPPLLPDLQLVEEKPQQRQRQQRRMLGKRRPLHQYGYVQPASHGEDIAVVGPAVENPCSGGHCGGGSSDTARMAESYEMTSTESEHQVEVLIKGDELEDTSGAKEPQEEALDGALQQCRRWRRRWIEELGTEQQRGMSLIGSGGSGKLVSTGQGAQQSARPPAKEKARAQAAASRLHLYGGDVAHQLVLPYCRLILHHAGSGTTAAALQCGVPQVTCPLHFDQFFWAERLADLGLSPPPLDRQLLFRAVTIRRYEADVGCRTGPLLDDSRVAALSAAFRNALHPMRLQAAQSMAQALAAEGGGLEVAAMAIRRVAEDKS